MIVGAREGGHRERRDHAEMSAAAAPERPEQVGLVRRARGDDAAVREHHPHRGHRVAGQPVRPGEDPHATALGEAGDADGRAGTARDPAAAGAQHVVHLDEGGAGADRRRRPVQADAVQGADVDDQRPVPGRPAGVAVSPGPDRHPDPVVLREGERGRDVLRPGHGEYGERPGSVVPRVLGESHRVVRRGAGPGQRPRHIPGELPPVGRGRPLPGRGDRRGGVRRHRRPRGVVRRLGVVRGAGDGDRGHATEHQAPSPHSSVHTVAHLPSVGTHPSRKGVSAGRGP